MVRGLGPPSVQEALGFWSIRFWEAWAAAGAELTRTRVFWF